MTSNVRVGVVTVGVAGTVDGDTGSGETLEGAADSGDVGDAGPGAVDRAAAADRPEGGVIVGDGEVWDLDVGCGVMVCTEVMTSVVRTTALFGRVIVFVLDVKDVWVEGSNGAEMSMGLEGEDL